MIKEEELLEQKELRDQLANRVEVLEKVKNLLLLPKTDFATTKQVAEFYEISESNIRSLYKEHRDEFDEDGAKLYKYDDFKKLAGTTSKMFRGKAIFTFDNNYELEVNPRGARLFPKRVILRMGMLLKTSDIAKQVRTSLLDIEEKAPVEIKLQDINEEQKIQLEVGIAFGTGNPETIMLANAKYLDFKNRHIKEQEQHINQLQQDNKALAGEILEWKDRSKINYAIRRYTMIKYKRYSFTGKAWSELYNELLYQHHINVRQRGKSPLIEGIKENEWKLVLQSFSALCEKENISPSDILKEALEDK